MRGGAGIKRCAALRSLRFCDSDAILKARPAPGWLSALATKEDNVLTLTANAAGAAEPGAPMNGLPQSEVTSEQILARILESLDDNKAEDVVQIDLRGKTSVCDQMVVCSGRSSRQVVSIAEKLVEDLKHDLGLLPKIEGQDTGDWVLVDTGDVIVHVFRPEVREFYQLEKMWMPLGKTAQTVT